MPRVNQEYREGAKERIITAAIEVAVEKGWGATTLDAIAQKTGVSITALYGYFRNRDELEREVFARVVRIHHDELAATLAPEGDIRRIICNYADLIFVRQINYANIYSQLPVRFLSDPAMRRDAEVSIKAESDLISGCLARAKSRGELADQVDPDEAAELIRILTAGIVLSLVFDDRSRADVQKALWITGVERILLINRDTSCA